MLWQAISAARDLGRLQEIAAVLIRYGFGDAVQRIGMAGALKKAGKVLHWRSGETPKRMQTPERVRRVLEDLGPTFVKLGQVLATRVDVFGPAWIEEFSRLQEKAPSVDWDEIHEQLTEDLGQPPEEVFTELECEPLASASLAQVHKARLRDGRQVVLKVRRPGIRATIEADLRLLQRLADIVEAEAPEEMRQYRPGELVKQFARSLHRELDFAAECRNAERIAAQLSPASGIVVPEVFWEYNGERLNVQRLIEGIAGNDIAGLEAAGLDRHRIARRGTHAILSMILEHGFFHADPHPGNIKFLPEDQIALLDFGMVGRLSQTRRREVADLLHGLVSRDPDRVTRILLDWSSDASTDRDRLEEDIIDFIEQYHGVALEHLDMSAMIGDMTGVLRRHQLILPADLVLMLKAFITLEGMGRSLDPEFDMASEAAPIVESVLKSHYSPSRIAERLQKSLMDTVRIVGALPEDLSRLLRMARRGRIEVHIDINSLKDVTARIDKAASRLTLGIVTAALIIGSAIALNVQHDPDSAGLPLLGTLGFIGAALGGIWLLISIWRSGRGD